MKEVRRIPNRQPERSFLRNFVDIEGREPTGEGRTRPGRPYRLIDVLRAAGLFRHKIRHDVQLQEPFELRRHIEHIDDARPKVVCRAAGRPGQEIMGRMRSDDHRSNENDQGNDEQKEDRRPGRVGQQVSPMGLCEKRRHRRWACFKR